MFEYNIILSRFINWPHTLSEIGYMDRHHPDHIIQTINSLAGSGIKVWGSAYVVTTHGLKMGKAEYLAHNVLGAVRQRLDAIKAACRTQWCAEAAIALEQIDGIGTFLAGQIVADLKNTKGHPLSGAHDWFDFVLPGPGSLRGCSWFHGVTVTPVTFKRFFQEIREYMNSNDVMSMCNQDLQNCLCEYDKYMRIKNGTGRSKRNYNGWGN